MATLTFLLLVSSDYRAHQSILIIRTSMYKLCQHCQLCEIYVQNSIRRIELLKLMDLELAWLAFLLYGAHQYILNLMRNFGWISF